ncbi:IGR protein motif-domain-containing protein [Calycina marina]|uniref:Small ribosomal subunit protein mS41 n=1 Tax=Calycina marina TaxID=1763456 RepID=A0A9P7Z6N8_9HELO|nr:IGR protein motif-domain-containing protein [Calycina marina]
MVRTMIKSALRPMPFSISQFQFLPNRTIRGLQSIPESGRRSTLRTPPTIPFVPDVQTFLKLIGRSLSKHSDKITSWSQLFSVTSGQLKGMGVEPPRARRYLLRWVEKYRKGLYGIGGDLEHVEDGAAHFKVAELPIERNISQTSIPLKKRKIVVNVPSDRLARDLSTGTSVPVKGLRVQGISSIVGKAVQPLKGKIGAKIVVTEGLWEDKRGRVIDGGERRRAEVAAKRRSEARRATR